ncbi:hypothetical protein HPB48_020897 [Haemaphysalis longicornis]|uniref:DDE-1 domain-containing protein n=1 Tax=Haemaphysalis longicornis TaxID=44386 RepID=A0A9J6H1N2_HAELO|nr:hypothetical protein HPB48_020897 [Haemaphysalis longicornis]
MDNCSANQTTCELDNIELKLQPLDRSTKSFKVGYRRRLLDRLLMNLRVNTELKVDQLGAIHMMTGAWNSVKQSVANCFRKAGFVTAEHSEACEDGDDDEWGMDDTFRELSFPFLPGCCSSRLSAGDFVTLTVMFRLLRASVTRIS